MDFFNIDTPKYIYNENIYIRVFDQAPPRTYKHKKTISLNFSGEFTLTRVNFQRVRSKNKYN
jgi:hypothetical protein